MKEAAKNLDFERAMELRDILFELKLVNKSIHRNCGYFYLWGNI